MAGPWDRYGGGQPDAAAGPWSVYKHLSDDRGLVRDPAMEVEFKRRAEAMDPTDLAVARSKNDPFGAFLRREAMKPVAGESDYERQRRLYGDLRPKSGALEGYARATLQGATMGFGDEMVAGMKSAVGDVPYDQALAQERQKLARFGNERPTTSTIAEVAGSIPTAMMIPGGAPVSLGGRVLVGTAQGATAGGLYGFGTGQGDAGSRASNAVTPAVVGATLGGLIAPLAGAGARAVGENVGTSRAADQAGMSTPAYRVLMRTLEADDTFGPVGQQRMAAAGPNAMLADAGPSARTVLDTAIQRAGQAGRIAGDAIEGRANVAAQQVDDALNAAFGAPRGRSVVESGIKQATAGAVDDLYTRAYQANRSVVSREIDKILDTPDGKRALKAAAETMQNSRSRMGVPDAELGELVRELVARGAMDAPPPGGVAQGLNLRSLDLVKRTLWDIAESKMKQTPYGAQETAASRASKGLWRDFVRALDEADVTRRAGPNSFRPEGGLYSRARALSQDAAENRDAFRLGLNVLSRGTTRDDIAREVADMTPQERAFVAQGIRSQLDEALANVKRAMTDGNMDAREAIAALRDLSSRAAREKVSSVVGEDTASQLFRTLDEAAYAFELRAGVATNSRTFARKATDDIVRAQTDEGIVNSLRSGRPVLGARAALAAVLGRSDAAKQRIADETYTELARALTSAQGGQLLARLNQTRGVPAAQAEETRRLVEALTRRSAVPAAAFAN